MKESSGGMIEIDDLYVCFFCQPIVSMHFCFFFSFDRSDVIRATFEMSGRAKHKTFAARIGASADCCNTHTQKHHHQHFIPHNVPWQCRRNGFITLCVARQMKHALVMFNLYLFLLCHPSAK